MPMLNNNICNTAISQCTVTFKVAEGEFNIRERLTTLGFRIPEGSKIESSIVSMVNCTAVETDDPEVLSIVRHDQYNLIEIELQIHFSLLPVHIHFK